MDLNADGNVDILSGSYSKRFGELVGFFFVLWGKEDGSFQSPRVLRGADHKALTIRAEEGDYERQSCTRPYAADLNGDGDLDLVVGNFSGAFFVFEGKGNGEFSPESKQLMAGDKPLSVGSHGDPFLIDWDKDGDLDILSGTGEGGVFLSTNKGSKAEPSFAKFIEIIEPKGHSRETIYGDEHISGANEFTRVWVADVNQDKKLDIIIGDHVSLNLLGEGVTKENVDEKLKQLNEAFPADTMKDVKPDPEAEKQIGEFFQEIQGLSNSTEGLDEVIQQSERLQKKLDEAKSRLFKAFEKHDAELAKITRRESTGFIWVYYQK